MPKAKEDMRRRAGRIQRLVGVIARIVFVFGFSNYCFSADETIAADQGLRMAPIRVQYYNSGSVDFLFRYNKNPNEYTLERTWGLQLGVGANAESFIWQPWFAQVGAGVQLGGGGTLSDAGRNGLGLSRNGQSMFRTVGGNAALRMIPYSRFPFTATFSRTDRRSEFGLVKIRQAMLTDQLRLTQRYRPPRGASSYIVTYDVLRIEDINALVDHTNSLNFEASLNPFPKQAIQLLGVRENRDSGATKSEITKKGYVIRHTYRPSAQGSLATMANYNDVNYRLPQSENGTQNQQFSSSGVWRPSGNFTLTGGVRLYDAKVSKSGGITSTSGYTGADLGASYNLKKWLRIYGSLYVYDQNGVQSVSSTSISNISAAAQNKFDVIKLGTYNYNRYASALLSSNTVTSNNSAGGTRTAQSLAITLQHGLEKTTLLDNDGRRNFVIRQTLLSSANSVGARGAKLMHDASLGWYGRSGGKLRLSGKDIRGFTGDKFHMQNVNLQGTQSERLSSDSALSGDLTINATRQDSASRPTADSLTSSAGLNYRNERVLKIARLVFKSSLKIISADLLDSNQEINNMGSYSWSNDLSYSIGRLDASLKGVMEEVSGSRRATLLLHVRRTF